MKKEEDRSVARDDYKLYSGAGNDRIAVGGGFTDAKTKFLHVLNYLGQSITSLSGYPSGTKVRIHSGSLAGCEAYISEFHLAKIRQTYHGGKVAYSLITMCSLRPIVQSQGADRGTSVRISQSELSDEENGKILLFYKEDYDVVDDSMRHLMNFHTQSSSGIIVFAINRRGDRERKPSVHTIGREGDSHEVDVNKAIAFLQEMGGEMQKAGR